VGAGAVRSHRDGSLLSAWEALQAWSREVSMLQVRSADTFSALVAKRDKLCERVDEERV
jgi:hypothetical protein